MQFIVFSIFKEIVEYKFCLQALFYFLVHLKLLFEL